MHSSSSFTDDTPPDNATFLTGINHAARGVATFCCRDTRQLYFKTVSPLIKLHYALHLVDIYKVWHIYFNCIIYNIIYTCFIILSYNYIFMLLEVLVDMS